MVPRIVIVDDEPDLLELVRVNLTQAGFEVEAADCGEEALALVERTAPDLLVVDLMLPDISGTEICRRLRANPETAELPIIMLTARADEVDRVVGFEVGADDYVTKPFSPRELVLRVRAILRRRGGKDDGTSSDLRRGELRIDTERRRCYVRGDEVELTAKEFDLLVSLVQGRGRVLSRDQLLDRVWGSEIIVGTRTIDTHLKRLREKLGEAGSMVETVRGVGYRFSA